MVVLYKTSFLKKRIIFHSNCTILIPINSTQQFQFLHILVNSCYLVMLTHSHLNRYEVITVILICISLTISDLNIFSCAFWPSVCLLQKTVYSSPLTFNPTSLFLSAHDIPWYRCKLKLSDGYLHSFQFLLQWYSKPLSIYFLVHICEVYTFIMHLSHTDHTF